MTTTVIRRLTAGLLLAAVILAASPALAQDEKPISTDELAIRMKALDKAQLLAESEEWFGKIKTKARLLSAAEVKAEKAGTPMNEEVRRLRRELGDLTDRLEVVLAALKKKGKGDGDVEQKIAEYQAYVAVVTGISLDPKDAGALYTFVSDWIVSPSGGIKWAAKIVLFIVALIVFRILAAVLGAAIRKAVSRMRNTSELLRDFFVNVVRKITFFVGLIVALSMIDVNIGPFVAALGVAGFIIGFALQGTLGNFASGIMILLYRPYDIGDFIDAGGVEGTVNAMSLVSTTLKTPDNQLVVIPNSSIWGGIITNVTGSDTRRVDMAFGIGYGDDIGKAQAILENIVGGHEKVLADPAPVVQLQELADSSVNFVVRPWAKTSDYRQVYCDVTRAVKERFDEEGISIPFPQRDVHVFQEAAAD